MHIAGCVPRAMCQHPVYVWICFFDLSIHFTESVLNVYKLLFKVERYQYFYFFYFFKSPLGSEHFHEMAPASLHDFWKVAEIGHPISSSFHGSDQHPLPNSLLMKFTLPSPKLF